MFKFTIRELFLLVALAGVGCAWWMECRKTSSLQNEVSERRLWADIEHQRHNETTKDLVTLVGAAEREGFCFFADAKQGVQMVRLDDPDEDVNPKGASAMGEGGQNLYRDLLLDR